MTTDDSDDDPPPDELGVLIKEMKPAAMSPVQERLCERAVEIIEGDPKDVLYQHSTLCQVYFPYRDPKTLRRWTRTNGRVSMLMNAGELIDPMTREFRPVGLPFGPKSRLVLAHLSTRALRAGSNVIPMEEGSFTAFVRSMQDPLSDSATAPNGREIRAYKEQLARFSVARLTLAFSIDDRHAIQQTPQIIEKLDVTYYHDERQRHLWPDSITLTPAFWDGLQKHAVPLDARALAALAHSALAIDIYQWLGQRLHRLPEGKDIILPRTLLHRQFGEGYAQERQFWSVFKKTLRQVLAVYNHARLFVTDEGLHLQHSLPPVPRRFQVVPKLPAALRTNGKSDP